MRLASHFGLIMALTGCAFPAAAQEHIHESVDVQWSRVRTLAPGTEVIVTISGSPPAERYFVAGNEFDITVLNLTDPALPAAARNVLRDTASNRAAYFSAAQKGGTFVLDNKVRLRPGGVFVADRKIADLHHIVETSDRTAVAEIKARKKGRGLWGHLGPLGGWFVGAMTGGYGAGFACRAASGRSRCDTGAFLTGALLGGIAGGAYGFRAANRETDVIVYRAP